MSVASASTRLNLLLSHVTTAESLNYGPLVFLAISRPLNEDEGHQVVYIQHYKLHSRLSLYVEL